MISNIGRPEFVQAGVSSSEDEDSEDEDETAQIEDETPIVEDLPSVRPAPTPVRDHRTVRIEHPLRTNQNYSFIPCFSCSSG